MYCHSPRCYGKFHFENLWEGTVAGKKITIIILKISSANKHNKCGIPNIVCKNIAMFRLCIFFQQKL